MTKRSHTLAMAGGPHVPFSPSCPTLKDQSCHYAPGRYSSQGNIGSTAWSNPNLGCNQSMDQAKYRCTESLREEAISITSSSDSGWSTSPQRLATADCLKVTSPGMTLRLGDHHTPQRPAAYWRDCPTQGEALLGCGSWLQDRPAFEKVQSMPFDQALAQGEDTPTPGSIVAGSGTGTS